MTEAEIGHFRRVESIFSSAIDQDPGPAREAWLNETCGEDADLFAEVSSFLREYEKLDALRPRNAESMPRFGAWQAVRLLGRGGMGTVYLGACRDEETDAEE